MILNNTLKDATQYYQQCEVPLFTFPLDHLPEDQRTGEALRLDAISWYGRGAGLQYLEIQSHPPTGPLVTIVVLVLLLASVLGVGGFVWSGREQLIARFQPKKEGGGGEGGRRRVGGGGGGRGRRVGFRPVFKTQQSRQALIEQSSLPTEDDTKEQN